MYTREEVYVYANSVIQYIYSFFINLIMFGGVLEQDQERTILFWNIMSTIRIVTAINTSRNTQECICL